MLRTRYQILELDTHNNSAKEMNGSSSESLDVHDMGSLWAETGVGMVNTMQMAGDIVQTVRDDALWKRIGSLVREE